MEAFSNIVTALDNWIWGLPMIVLLLGTHLFMTVRTGFIPVSYTHLDVYKRQISHSPSAGAR